MKCIACNGESWRESFKMEELTRAEYPKTEMVAYFVCGMCGLVRKDPLPSSDVLREHYRSSWQYATSRPNRCFDTAAGFIRRHLKYASGRAVDVGSKGTAIGEALALRGFELEWQMLDPHPTMTGIREGWLGDDIIPTRAYDFLSATHVMEHVHDPRQFIKDALGLIKYTGAIYIEVPSLEGHADDAGSCDDINRDHLWHFTAHSLWSLAKSAGAYVIACETDRLAKWPVHRLLLGDFHRAGKDSRLAMQRSRERMIEEYDAASERLMEEDPREACLYGASHSALIFLRDYPDPCAKFRLFDLYRYGHTLAGTAVEHPDRMVEEGIKRAYITTRFWNAYKDIAAWMKEHIPSVEPLTPFQDMEQ